MDVAAFDFDGTLTDGGSVVGFLVALAGRPAVLAASGALAPQLALAGLSGGHRADRTKERLFQRVLAGIAVEHVLEVACRYGPDHLHRHLRTAVRDRLDWHRRRGDHVVVVSASPEVYVRPAVEQLGIDQVVATRLEVSDGVMTGRYEGANCRGEEKVRRLRLWIAELPAAPGRVWSYGNSRGDLTMLRAADIGVNVGRLGPVGALRAYPGLGRTGPGTLPA